MVLCRCCVCVFFCKQKTAYEMRISDWSSDVCSSDLLPPERRQSTLLESVHRPGEVIVEEMGEPRHAEARGVEFVKVGELAFEDVQIGRASCRERVCQYV